MRVVVIPQGGMKTMSESRNTKFVQEFIKIKNNLSEDCFIGLSTSARDHSIKVDILTFGRRPRVSSNENENESSGRGDRIRTCDLMLPKHAR